jgi:hypothetical protein
MSFNHFPEIAGLLVAACIAIDEKTADDITEMAQANCPVETGALRDSIHTEPGEGDVDVNIVVGEYYGVFVELGHHTRGGVSWVPAEPFFFPAVEQGGGIFESNFEALEGMLAV